MEKVARLIGYVRAGPSEKGDSRPGLEAQRRAIRREVSRRGWKLLSIQQDVAASRSANGHPGLELAIGACDRGEATGLIVANLDRLSDSLSDFAALAERARKKHWKVVALDVGVDTTTAVGEMQVGLLSALARWERRVIGERKRDLMHAKGHMDRRPPALDPRVSARIHKLRARGYSYGAIAEVLNEAKVSTPQGGMVWYPATVRALGV